MAGDICRLHALLVEACKAATEKYDNAQKAVSKAKAELKAARAAGDLMKTKFLLEMLRDLEREAARAESRLTCARGDLYRFENMYRLNKRPGWRRSYRSGRLAARVRLPSAALPAGALVQ
ncbi:MAG TPA: hypothetical protein VF194_02410 [Ferrovibrio sp.]|uniref:hypothetical protein n=1 Tax=Ferrovibrio sp. TaxID=1917215 RepID=UPI002ED68C2C